MRVVAARSVGVRIDAEWVDRFRYFDRLVERAGTVRGTVVECGVAAGQSLAILATLFRARHDERAFWGFDTFAGLPEPAAEDLITSGGIARTGSAGPAVPRSPQSCVGTASTTPGSWRACDSSRAASRTR